MNELALFAGAGGGILGGILNGWRTRCAVEIDPYCRKVLLQRQRDGILPRFPIWDDVQTFDGRPWRGEIDIVTGGFPCQDISAAGKGAGITGERSGLWKHMARIIGEVRPRYAFVENSPLLVRRGFAVVLSDLAEMGFDARWCVLGAHHAGAPHKRDRIWILAQSRSEGTGNLMGEARNANGRTSRKHVPTLRQAHGADGSDRADPTSEGEIVIDANGKHEQGKFLGITNQKKRGKPSQRPAGPFGNGIRWWQSEPGVGGTSHGVA
jgi:DNA (cytosine-5)-methyltransferase 1